ncbi:glutamyl-tRNA(Gln) amidotransferase subunit C, mitochondrial [Lucilia sericata]|uniref:glutamyl-tRNA(Gln) amidotransferase subunit C, mitochondrial n=1 Tax=Lucilia sericata TaxID=13632 RepID=UPI0018A8245E|nr:glutamyl-tRNA(Gln) amidotransferase subunit C, mitochondrial [Lucilia sericata]
MKRLLTSRSYCVSAAKTAEEKLDFKQLRHISKVPDQPVKEELNHSNEKVFEISKKTVQLLERLALVNLDGEEALKTLRSSIQFAKRIENIDISNKKPLYTVLENQALHLRSDKINEGNCREEILKNAKITEEDYFISPPGNIPLQQEDIIKN